MRVTSALNKQIKVKWNHKTFYSYSNWRNRSFKQDDKNESCATNGAATARDFAMHEHKDTHSLTDLGLHYDGINVVAYL